MFAGAVDLGAVARRQDGGLGRAREGVAQGLEGGLDLVDGIGEAAAQIQRRGRVIDAQCPDCHGQDYKICLSIGHSR
jgi:hypothetical protein